MARNGNNKGAVAQLREEDISVTDEDKIKARECGLYGLNVREAEAYIGLNLSRASTAKLLRQFEVGKAEHAFSIMQAIYKKAVGAGDAKLLMWLAENSLKKTLNAEVEENVFAAMTPEQRRDEIKRLTKQIEQYNG